MFAMRDERTLCPRCRADYLAAGYRLRLIPGQLREPCDLCGRSGRNYQIEERQMLKACKYCGRVHDSSFDCGRRPRRTKFKRSEAELPRYSAAMNAKSREIKERQRFLCPLCLRVGDLRPKRLETHHIQKLRLHPELMLDDGNLIALCEVHHELAERGDVSAEALRQLAAERDRGIPPGVGYPRCAGARVTTGPTSENEKFPK